MGGNRTNASTSTWHMGKYIPGTNGGKERADVSFLKEKQALIFSQNASKKMALDP